jgi:outer membrane receptor for ferrienterochelin and colicins
MKARAGSLTLLVALALVPVRARAQADGSDVASLLDEPVIATASITADTSDMAPAVSSILTAEDLRRFGIHSLGEAINFLSLGMVTSNPLHSVEIGARGVLLTGDYGNHVLLLIDGHAVNEPWAGTAYFDRGAVVPMELIDHVEVVLGPGSVLYGSNAMLGVINVVTKHAKDFSGWHAIIESDIPKSLRLSAGVGKGFHWLGRPAELTLQAEYLRQDGPAFTFGPQNYGLDTVTGEPKRFSPDGPATGMWGGKAEHSYYTRVPSVYARLVLGNLQISARAATYKRATPYLDSLVNSQGDFDSADNYELDRWASLDAKYRRALSPVADLRIRLYGDANDYQLLNTSSAAEDCLAGQLQGCRRRLYGGSFWAGSEIQTVLDWWRDSRFVTLVGLDARVRHIQSKLDITDRITGDNPGSRNVYATGEGLMGAYLQQTVRPTQWLGINAGARLDLDQRFGSAFSPRIVVTARSWAGGSLKAIYSQAFRAPTLYELRYEDPIYGDLASPNLRPETVRSVEGAIEQRLGTHRFLVGAFRTWWHDLILSSEITPDELAAAIARGELPPGSDAAQRYQNAGGTIDNLGVNAGWESSFLERRLHFGMTLTAATARRRSADGSTQPLTVAPQIFGNARLVYEFGGYLPTLAIVGQMQGKRYADRAFDSGYSPSPSTPTQTRLRGTISGGIPGTRRLTYRLISEVVFPAHEPYVIGPRRTAAPDQPTAELAPLQEFRLSVGLRYEFIP